MSTDLFKTFSNNTKAMSSDVIHEAISPVVPFWSGMNGDVQFRQWIVAMLMQICNTEREVFDADAKEAADSILESVAGIMSKMIGDSEKRIEALLFKELREAELRANPGVRAGANVIKLEPVYAQPMREEQIRAMMKIAFKQGFLLAALAPGTDYSKGDVDHARAEAERMWQQHYE